MSRRLLALFTPLLLLFAAPASALAAEASFEPDKEFELPTLFHIDLFGLDLSITKGILYIWIATVLTVGVITIFSRRLQARPNRTQALLEYFFTSMQNLTGGAMDTKMATRWFPFIATMFAFIWFSNMIGYLPLPTNIEHKFSIGGLEIPSFALYAATANLGFPLVLAFIVWCSYHVEGVRAKGVVKYVAGWVPAGIEGPAKVPIFFIEALSQVIRLVSLSVRLFANILAGHLLLLFMGGGLVVILGLGVLGSVVLGAATGALAVVFFIFEIGLVATLQAFIFSTLTAIYLGEAVAEEH